MTANALPIISSDELGRIGAAHDEAGCGCLSTDRGVLPLAAMDIDARIDGLMAHTKLRQTFVNALSVPLEATYIFPLPDRAAVTAFRFEVNGRVVEGVIKERGEARRTYDRAIAAGHRAAITEEERAGVFTMRVGNLQPGERATVELELVGALPFDSGEATFRFPLVVAPRYIPGVALDGESVGDGVAHDTDAVPDASRISPPVLLPGFPNPVRLGLRVAIDAGQLPLSNLRSTLHAARIEPPSAGDAAGGGAPYRSPEGVRHFRVELAPEQRLDRDFILRFSLGDEAVQSDLALRADATGGEGTFALTVVPPLDSGAVAPRDVIFVLDRSGSMGGWKMVAARRAVARMIDTLRDRDSFAVMAFDDMIESPPLASSRGVLVPASDRNRFRAVEWLSKVDARGGTEMAQPLIRAADALGGGYDDRQRVLVLVTDGQVGNEDQILRELSRRLKNVRVYTLGIDRSVNLAFLRRLAATGAGLCELVESEDRLDEVMDRVHRRIGSPVLTELSVSLEGAEIVTDSISPARMPDLFAGAPLTLYGRYRAASGGAVRARVQGRRRDGERYERSLEGSTRPGRAVPTVWARAHLRDLEDRYAVQGGGELTKRIIDVSLRFGVLCRFTAFVAVDKSERVERAGELHRATQPVQMPSGWQGSGVPGGGGGRAAGLGGLVARKAAVAGPADAQKKEAFAAAVPMQAMKSMDLMDDVDDEIAEMDEMALDGYAMAEEAAAPPPAAPEPVAAAPAPAPAPAPAKPRMRSESYSVSGTVSSSKARKGKRKQSAPPAPPLEYERNIIRRGIDALLGRSERDVLDLSSYRARAEELLRLVERFATDLRGAYAELLVGLTMLVEDLTSVGAQDEAAALSQLLEALRATAPDTAEREELIARARELLDRFARGEQLDPSSAPSAPRAPSRRDGDFWK